MTTYLGEVMTRDQEVTPTKQATVLLASASEKGDERRTWRRERPLRSPCGRRQPCQLRRPIWYQSLTMRSVAGDIPTQQERARNELGG